MLWTMLWKIMDFIDYSIKVHKNKLFFLFWIVYTHTHRIRQIRFLMLMDICICTPFSDNLVSQ